MLLALMLGQAAVPAVPLPPAGKWVVEYNEGNCTISRGFGDPARPVTFAFQPLPTAVSGAVFLIAPGKASGPGNGTGKVTLASGDRKFDAHWMRGPLPDDRHGIRFVVDQEFWKALPDAQTISFDDGDREKMAAALDKVPQALAAAKACGDDLLRHWGADPDAMLPTGPMVASWISAGDYPLDALRNNQQGRVQALATFDRSGRPTACRVVVSSGVPSLDAGTCAIIRKRGRVPTGETEPERRFMFLAVNWILPI